jgi:hypothetical protein
MLDTSQTCVVTRKVIENDFQIVQFVHSKAAIDDQPSSWLFLHGDEESGFLNDLEQIEFMPLSRVILQRPFVREYLDTPVGGNFTIDQDTGQVFDWTEQRTLSMDRRVSVPTAARVHFNILRWLRLFPADALSTLIALFGLILGIVVHPACLLITLYFSLHAFVRFVTLNEHFKLGEARPSIVVSVKPLLIATEVEFEWKVMRRRFVKITKIRRRALEPEQIVVGAMLTSAVLFKSPKWYDSCFNFNPLPLNYATNDMNEIERTSDHLLPSYRESLEDSLKYISGRPKVGIYEIPPQEATEYILP